MTVLSEMFVEAWVPSDDSRILVETEVTVDCRCAAFRPSRGIFHWETYDYIGALAIITGCAVCRSEMGSGGHWSVVDWVPEFVRWSSWAVLWLVLGWRVALRMSVTDRVLWPRRVVGPWSF